MSTVDDELGNAIEELCFELFSSRTASDAVPVLRAASSLAASSRSAQTRVGRAFAEEQKHPPIENGKRRVVRLRLLADRFLLEGASSLAALGLLAVLAHDNLVNQRRIARHVPGVCVSFSRSPSPQSPSGLRLDRAQQHVTGPLVVLVLSLPSAVRTQYKQWRSRHRLLQGHHVPTGVPPSRDGVPASCFCNDCLGSPQLLATWADHFHDLARWAQETDPIDSVESPRPPQFSGDVFIQRVLESDYHRLSSSWTAAANDSTEPPLASGGAVPKIHFFAPTSSGNQSNADGHGLLCPDPRHHVCGIEIDHSVVSVASDRQYHLQTSQKRKGEDEQATIHEEPLNRILLLQHQAPVPYCPAFVDEPAMSEEPRSRSWYRAVEHFVHDMEAARDKGASILVTHVVEQVRASATLEELDRTILSSILEYLEPNLLVSLEVLKHSLLSPSVQALRTVKSMRPACPVPTDPCAEPQMCDVSVFATMSHPSLEILARCRDGVVYGGSAALPAEAVSEHSSQMCALDDDSLCEMLQYCRLCREHHSSEHSGATEWICLTPMDEPRNESQPSQSSPSKNVPEYGAIRGDEIADTRPQRKPHTRGLSPSAVRLLQDLKEKLAAHSGTLVEDVTKCVQRVVHDCNARMVALASESRLTPPLREAARERCRVCRDLVVQAGKRMKLGTEGTESKTLSHVAARRFQREIDRVLQLSEVIDPWETPDARVEQMHLNRQVWASGVPDPEFYVNTKERSRENRVAQRQLNQRLVHRLRKGATT